jgi:hypothetical protein
MTCQNTWFWNFPRVYIVLILEKIWKNCFNGNKERYRFLERRSYPLKYCIGQISERRSGIFSWDGLIACIVSASL